MKGRRHAAADRLCLGTAQIGLDYGIANGVGVLGEAAAAAVLDQAWECGIRWFDTARAYGRAEARIGRWLERRGHAARLVTKLPPVVDATEVAAGLAASTAALGRTADIVLVHRAEDLDRAAVADALADAVASGRIAAFGASVYSPGQARRALAVGGIGAMQLPLNLVDRRALDDGVVDQARAHAVRLFARSAFLQGALTMAPAALPAHLAPLRAPLARLARIADRAGCSVAGLALAAALSVDGIERVVIGAERPEQVAANAAAAAAPPPREVIYEAVAVARALPLEVIDPSRWPAGGKRRAVGDVIT